MKRFFVCFIFSTILFASYASTKPFTVVIDPGHGGKDPGAMGPNAREKDINLKVSLKLGELITKNNPDVKVIYTRDVDKYVPLQDRSSLANKVNGDLFICIHTNASTSKSPYGAETYTIGLDKTNANFEVAKRENSVILLEDGYKEKYQGFDPTSPDSYIMFEFMQSKFSDKSIEFAAYTQDELVSAKRYNRGVRQENFWVLHQTKMPSVLIELGFISNPSEERFLLSNEGQNVMANSIYKAFAKYKHEYDKKNIAAATNTNDTQTPSVSNIDTPVTQMAKTNQVTYLLQLFITRKKITNSNDSQFRGLTDCTFYEEGNWYKYTYGSTIDLDEILTLKNRIKPIFPEAFIVVFYKGKKISLQEAEKITK